jgi:hypothetical protein
LPGGVEAGSATPGGRVMPSPSTIAFTTTQMTIALLLSVLGLISAGVAFGRLTERQKSDHKLLHDTLGAFRDGLAAIKEQLTEMHERHQKEREEWVDWRFWRVVTDERLGGHDEDIGHLTHGHEEVKTRVVVLEDRRTSGTVDRRHP